MTLRADEWEAATEAPEITESLGPILLLAHYDEGKPDPIEQPEEYAGVMSALSQCAVDIYDWWQQR